MKKRILVFSHAMELGGAETALLGLLEALDKRTYDVDLFLMRHTGELLKYIPQEINLLPEVPQYASLAVPISEVIQKKQIGVLFGRYVGKKLSKLKIQKLDIRGENNIPLEYSHKYTQLFMPKIGVGLYDLAISFLTPHFFVATKVKAKKKIAWIHTDYSSVITDHNMEVKMWEKYDAIASISKSVTDSFVSSFPELKNKVIQISNILPVAYIIRRSQEVVDNEMMISSDSIKLLTIGRFCYPKNFENIPYICAEIRKRGYNVKWYIIGYGNDRYIKDSIDKAGMNEYVIILGKKDNPYPYIRACDLYVQPSRYEGKSIAVLEAQTLKKPVVITNYETSSSQLVNGVDGLIVPLNNEGAAEGIVSLLCNNELISQIIDNCSKRDYSNVKETLKLYKLMED